MNSSYKVFIIDEVHMLTNQAFNALLRTLEEPPSHGKFILATTDIHKVPSTIISRCQRFDFNRITLEVISNRLSLILKSEKISIDKDSLLSISQKADGSMRDALSLLDQVIAYSGESISIKDVSTVIGLIPNEIYFDFSNAIVEKDYNKMITVIESIHSAGLSLQDITEGLIKHYNNLLITLVDKGEDLLSGISEDVKNQYINSSNSYLNKDIIRISKVLHDMQYSLKQVSQPMIVFEMTALKLLEMDTSVSIAELISDISSKESKKKVIESKESSLQINDNLSDSQDNHVDQVNEESEKPKTTNDEKLKPLFDLEVIKDTWNDFVSKVSNNRPSIATILEHADPIELNGNSLTVNIVDLPKFSIGNLEHNQELINQFAKEHYDIPLKIVPKLVQSNNSDNISKKNDSKVDEDHSSNSKDTVISKVLEVFDGEILR